MHILRSLTFCVAAGISATAWAQSYPSPIYNGLTINGAALYLSRTINPSGTLSASNLGFYANEVLSGTACTTNCYGNVSNIQDSVAATSGDGLAGWYFNHNFGGASATGNRVAGIFNLLVNQTTGNVNVGASYSGLDVYATSTVNDNGVSGTPSGQIEALNVIAKLGTSATYYLVQQIAEFDIRANSGSSVSNKVGVQITQMSDDAVSGSVTDAALAITNQNGAPGWVNGLLFGGQEGVWPFKSSSVAIACAGACGTATSFIDMTNASFSGYDWKFANASLSGAGALALTYETFGTGTVASNPGQANVLRLYDTGVSTTSYGFGVSTGVMSVVAGTTTSFYNGGTDVLDLAYNVMTSHVALSAPSFTANGNAGFSGTKTAGSCAMTFTGGILTGVTGC